MLSLAPFTDDIAADDGLEVPFWLSRLICRRRAHWNGAIRAVRALTLQHVVIRVCSCSSQQ
jgi:hypothetical protein